MQKHHFALAVALLCAAPVYAQTPGNLPTNYLPVEQKQFGNSYQWTPANAAPSTSGAVYGPNRGWSEISNAEPKINTYQKLPFDNRASIPDAQKAKIASPFTKANFGKALTFGARQLWPIGAVITAGEIYDYLNSEGFLNARNTPEGIIADKVREVMEDPRYVWSSSRLGDSVRFSSQQAACNATLDWHYKSNPVTTYAITTCSYDAGIVIRQINIYGGTAGYYNYSMGRWASPCGGGEVWIDGERKCKAATVDKLNQQQIEDQIAQDAGWPTSAARALQKALEVPGNHLKTEPPTVTGPSSIPGTTTTTTQPTQVAPGTNTPVSPGTPGAEPATQTTTTTNTTNNTYNGNTVTTTNVTNTTTTITNNVTNTTTTTNPPTTTTTDAPPPPEIETCGLPGKPACKIDETGTPQAKQDTSEADAKKAYKPLEDFVENPTSALPTFPTINWAFTLPSGCAPIALPAFEPWLQQIDVCAFQPMFHDLMSFVWVMGGIFGAIGTFWRNTFSQG